MLSVANPLLHPLFHTLNIAVGTLLAVGLVVVLFVERANLGQLRQSSLFKQWYCGSALGVVAIGAVLSGGAVLAFFIAAAVTAGVFEYSRVTQLTALQRQLLVVSGLAVVLAGALGGSAALPVVLVAGFLALGMASMVGSDGRNFDKAAIACAGLVYIPFLATHLLLITRLTDGAGILLALVSATAMADTGAFTMGKLFGRKLFNGKKLAPNLSPNKTWAGVLGGFIGAYAGLWLMRFAVPSLSLLMMLVIAPIVTVTGIAGDLFESLMKRSFGVKDAGTWLPGFGGILDRVDAMLFVIPAVYCVLALARLVG